MLSCFAWTGCPYYCVRLKRADSTVTADCPSTRFSKVLHEEIVHFFECTRTGRNRTAAFHCGVSVCRQTSNNNGQDMERAYKSPTHSAAFPSLPDGRATELQNLLPSLVSTTLQFPLASSLSSSVGCGGISASVTRYNYAASLSPTLSLSLCVLVSG